MDRLYDMDNYSDIDIKPGIRCIRMVYTQYWYEDFLEEPIRDICFDLEEIGWATFQFDCLDSYGLEYMYHPPAEYWGPEFEYGITVEELGEKLDINGKIITGFHAMTSYNGFRCLLIRFENGVRFRIINPDDPFLRMEYRKRQGSKWINVEYEFRLKNNI